MVAFYYHNHLSHIIHSSNYKKYNFNSLRYPTQFSFFCHHGIAKEDDYLNTLMYSEAIPSHIVCWEKRIIYVYWINAASTCQLVGVKDTKRVSYYTASMISLPTTSFSFDIKTTSLHWYPHLARIKHIPRRKIIELLLTKKNFMIIVSNLIATRKYRIIISAHPKK